MVVFFVGLEVFRQIVDALCEDRDLNFRRACIALFDGELFDEFGLFAFVIDIDVFLFLARSGNFVMRGMRGQC